MGQIQSSVGLISGIDYASIIEQLIAIESRPIGLLQSRNSVLQAQQTAFQDVNAKLLSLKLNASSLAKEDQFDRTTSSSSNESVLTVSSGTGAIPGNYSFRINRLVAAQQSISRGFQDTDGTTFAANTLTFERGEARLDSTTLLSGLNGGDGVGRGLIRISDRSGNTAVVDLTTTVTVDDVVDKINATTGVNVIAEIDGDGLTITDATGQSAADLVIADVGTTGTATSLGIAASSATGQIVGSAINTVGDNTLIASLNDGNGVRIDGSQDDFLISTGAGGAYQVSLAGATTLGDVREAIETASGGVVTLAANNDGTGISLIDTTGGSGLTVSALNGSLAAQDLGVLKSDAGDGTADSTIQGDRILAGINSKLLKFLNGGAGVGMTPSNISELTANTPIADFFNGAGLSTTGDATTDIRIWHRDGGRTSVDLDGATTVQDLMDTIATATGGKAVVTIEGNALRISDTTGGIDSFRVVDNGGTTAATDLGWPTSPIAADTALGADLAPVATATGPASIGSMDITSRDGVTTTINLDNAESVNDVISAINNAGAGVTAALNQSGNGLLLTDNSGGNGDLIVADNGGTIATDLGLAGTYADDEADSGNLQFQYVTEGTRIEALGITRGRFTITDSEGVSATVDLTQGNELTIGDVISEINSRGLGLTARINDNGDGILLEDDLGGAQAIKVEEAGSSTAADLGLLGEASAAGEDLDGSFEKTVEIEADATLSDIVLAINNAGVGVSASIINDGSAAAPYRLSLASDDAGSDGAFVFDDGDYDFGVTTLNEAQDAVVFFGSADPTNALVITSKTNTLENVIPGATLNLLATSNQPVQVTISEDTGAVVSAVSAFVDSFNTMIDTFNTYDTYNAETEQRGLLLGDATIGRVRQAIYNSVIGANNDLSGQYTALSQVGVTVGQGAQLRFDSAKFLEAYQNDPEAVKQLFSLEQFELDDDGEETDTLVARGVGVEIDQLLERLTDSIDGSVQRQIDTIQDQIDLNNDRIDDVDARLEAKRARLEAEFIAMETALAQLQDQGAALGQIQAVQPIQTNSGG